MLIIAGTITLPAEKLDEAMAISRPLCELVRSESGCQDYLFTVNTEVPGELRLFEVWDNEEGLHVHFTTPHMTQWLEDVTELGVIDRDVTRYDVSNTSPM